MKLLNYKILFTIIVILDFEIEQIDIKIIFLYRNVDEIIYVEQLLEFNKGLRVYKFNKTFYGFK